MWDKAVGQGREGCLLLENLPGGAAQDFPQLIGIAGQASLMLYVLLSCWS